MKRLLAFLGTLVLVFGMGPRLTIGQEMPNGVPRSAEQAEVEDHIDGDKIKVKIGGNTEEVLFVGVDAPEPKKDDENADCFAIESADRVKELIPKGTVVFLERDQTDRDKKDRLLRYVWVPGDEKAFLLNTKLVREGFAGFDPMESNDKYDKQIKKAENDAKKKHRGLWATCGGVHEEALRCEPVAQEVVNGIATGIKPETGASLRGAQAVRSDDFEEVWFVAADFEGPGLEGTDQIGVWATNDIEVAGGGLIFSVDGMAKEFSDWGAGDTTDANITINDDGAEEAKDCVKRALKLEGEGST